MKKLLFSFAALAGSGRRWPFPFLKKGVTYEVDVAPPGEAGRGGPGISATRNLGSCGPAGIFPFPFSHRPRQSETFPRIFSGAEKKEFSQAGFATEMFSIKLSREKWPSKTPGQTYCFCEFRFAVRRVNDGKSRCRDPAVADPGAGRARGAHPRFDHAPVQRGLAFSPEPGSEPQTGCGQSHPERARHDQCDQARRTDSRTR